MFPDSRKYILAKSCFVTNYLNEKLVFFRLSGKAALCENVRIDNLNSRFFNKLITSILFIVVVGS